jgi:hypothetical protein
MMKFEDATVSVKMKLFGLWVTFMFLYAYCDIFSLFRPGIINEMIAGFIGPFAVSQMSLVLTSMIPAIPALMILVCLFIKPGVARWINIIAGVVYTFVGIGNLIGETWAYYLIYGVLEILISVLVVITAIKWPQKEEGGK